MSKWLFIPIVIIGSSWWIIPGLFYNPYTEVTGVVQSVEQLYSNSFCGVTVYNDIAVKLDKDGRILIAKVNGLTSIIKGDHVKFKLYGNDTPARDTIEINSTVVR